MKIVTGIAMLLLSFLVLSVSAERHLNRNERDDEVSERMLAQRDGFSQRRVERESRMINIRGRVGSERLVNNRRIVDSDSRLSNFPVRDMPRQDRSSTIQRRADTARFLREDQVQRQRSVRSREQREDRVDSERIIRNARDEVRDRRTTERSGVDRSRTFAQRVETRRMAERSDTDNTRTARVSRERTTIQTGRNINDARRDARENVERETSTLFEPRERREIRVAAPRDVSDDRRTVPEKLVNQRRIVDENNNKVYRSYFNQEYGSSLDTAWSKLLTTFFGILLVGQIVHSKWDSKRFYQIKKAFMAPKEKIC